MLCLVLVYAEISGVVVDSEGSPVEYCAVSLFEGDSLVGGAYTDSDGTFAFSGLSDGDYVLILEHLSFLPETIRVHLEGESKSLRIVLRERAIEVGEEVVTAPRPIVRMEGSKRVVIPSSASAGGKVEDVLREVPGVSVVGDNVQIKGRSDFVVYVNGRPHPLGKQVLKRMPASRVSRIEIITNPSAKYEASAPIIVNIVLRRAQGREFSSSLSAGLWDRYSADVLVGFDMGRSAISMAFSLSNWTNYRSDSVVLDFQGMEPLVYTGASYQRYPWASARISMDYRLTDSVFLEGEIVPSRWWMGMHMDYGEDGGTASSVGGYLSGYAGIRKGDNRVGVFYSRSSSTTSSSAGSLSSSSTDTSTILRINADFRWGGYSFGYLGDVRRVDNVFSSGDYEKNASYSRSSHALYLMRSGSMPANIRYEAGLRAEYLRIISDTGLMYLNFYPSVSLSRTFPGGLSASISYSRRVKLPPIWLSTTYSMYVTPYFKVYRDAPKYPYFINSLELNLGSPILYLSLSYERNNNEWVTDFPVMKGDTFLLINRVFDRVEYYTITASINYRFLRFSPTVRYAIYSGDGETFRVFNPSAQMSIRWRNFYVFLDYVKPYTMFYNTLELKPPFFIGAGYRGRIGKSFMLNASLTFPPGILMRSEIGDNTLYYSSAWFSPAFSITLTYNFQEYSKLSRRKSYDMEREVKGQ